MRRLRFPGPFAVLISLVTRSSKNHWEKKITGRKNVGIEGKNDSRDDCHDDGYDNDVQLGWVVISLKYFATLTSFPVSHRDPRLLCTSNPSQPYFRESFSSLIKYSFPMWVRWYQNLFLGYVINTSMEEVMYYLQFRVEFFIYLQIKNGFQSFFNWSFTFYALKLPLPGLKGKRRN